MGEAPLNRVAQPLAPLVHEALAQLALSPDSAHDLAQVQVQVDELPSAAVDAPMLRQVFVNLLGNAVRFAAAAGGGGSAAGASVAGASVAGTAPAEQRAPSVRVGWRTEGRHAEFFVADSGAGFPPDAVSRLFQPFALLHGGGLSRDRKSVV